ncbi:uncharacterized protein [Triticum aestivum]|uniref:uncharacterized protein isoform X1 n=1 Tax=Triticum aestivum TaxID=4565 RepID=UPI001D02680A|nr:uncharacterized protein LOC123077783 isoform X1 [Triticum aestivum]
MASLLLAGGAAGARRSEFMVAGLRAFAGAFSQSSSRMDDVNQSPRVGINTNVEHPTVTSIKLDDVNQSPRGGINTNVEQPTVTSIKLDDVNQSPRGGINTNVEQPTVTSIKLDDVNQSPRGGINTNVEQPTVTSIKLDDVNQSPRGGINTNVEQPTVTSIKESMGNSQRASTPHPSDLLKFTKLKTDTETNPFSIGFGNAASGDVQKFLDILHADEEFYKESIEENVLKEMYFSVVRPALIPRCLIFPYEIGNKHAPGLHEAYKTITKREEPLYISSRDLMITLSSMANEHWVHLLNFFSDQRVLVIEDWCNSYGTLFGAGRYDHGFNCAPTGEMCFKGECDASVKGGMARICCIIWRGNQIVACQVLTDIPCQVKKDDRKGKSASARAEALAMFYLLKLAISLGIDKLQVSTDNRTVDEVLRGTHEISEENDCKRIYEVLRSLKRCFNILISRWEPRCNLSFVDQMIQQFD